MPMLWLAVIAVTARLAGAEGQEACTVGAAKGQETAGQILQDTSLSWLQISCFLTPCTLILISLLFQLAQGHEKPKANAAFACGGASLDFQLEWRNPRQISEPGEFRTRQSSHHASNSSNFSGMQGIHPGVSEQVSSLDAVRSLSGATSSSPNVLAKTAHSVTQKRKLLRAKRARKVDKAIRASLERAQLQKAQASLKAEDGSEASGPPHSAESGNFPEPEPTAPSAPVAGELEARPMPNVEEIPNPMDQTQPELPPVIPFQKQALEELAAPAPADLPPFPPFKGGQQKPLSVHADHAGESVMESVTFQYQEAAEVSTKLGFLSQPTVGDARAAASSESWQPLEPASEPQASDGPSAVPSSEVLAWDPLGLEEASCNSDMLLGSLGFAALMSKPLPSPGQPTLDPFAPGEGNVPPPPGFMRHLKESLRDSSIPSELSEGNPLVIPSLGSFGHPDMCYRPCVYLEKGGCKRDVFCTHCHFDHEPSNKLGKNQKKFLDKQLDEGSVLAAVLPFLRAKAIERGLQREAMSLCALIQNRVEELSSHAVLRVIPPELGHTMSRLSLHSLLSVLIRRKDFQPDFMDRLTVAVAQFRASIPTSLRSIESSEDGVLRAQQPQPSQPSQPSQPQSLPVQTEMPFMASLQHLLPEQPQQLQVLRI